MRTGGTLLLAIALTSTVLAGCLGSDADPNSDLTGPTEAELVDVLDALAAGEPAANIDLLGRWDEGGNAELDSWGDYLFVMKNPDVAILNIADENDIHEVGRITLPSVKDVKVSNDGNWAFVGNDGFTTDNAMLPNTPAGFYVLDVSDKENPKEVSFLQADGRRGPHMVFYHEMADGRELVFGANADISINEFDRASGTLRELSRYSPDILFDWNRDLHVIDVLYQGWAHDMFVMDDPVTGETLMYVANWDAGLRVVDVSNPSAPKELGKWMDFPEDHAGNLHTVATAWIGDRRITVGSPEVGFAVVGGVLYLQQKEWTGVYVWDTTDPANIGLLSLWTNPIQTYAERGADPPFAALGERITSSHNLQFEDGRVYIAHYELGVWVIDISDEERLRSPETLGYYMEDGMNTWDVVLNNGRMFLGDGKGVLSLRFVHDVVGEDGITSRA